MRVLANAPYGDVLSPSQEQRLIVSNIDLAHFWWWKPRQGCTGPGFRTWRGIALTSMPYRYREDRDDWMNGTWDQNTPCETLYAAGHNLPADELLQAVAAHASWGHPAPRPLRALTPDDLVEGWAEFLRHKPNCRDSLAGCRAEDTLYIFDADPGDYRVTPVTVICQPEVYEAVNTS